MDSFDQHILDQSHDYSLHSQDQDKKIDIKTKKVREQGFYYICGYDSERCPVLVFRADKLIDNFVTFTYYLRVMNQVHQQLIKKKVANWTIIFHVGEKLFTDIPLIVIQKFSNQAMKHCPHKLKKLYMVSCSHIAWLSWKAYEKAIPPDTRKKITLSTAKSDQRIFEYCDSDQIEIQFGGTKQKITNFWPLQIPEDVKQAKQQKKKKKDKTKKHKQKKKQYLEDQVCDTTNEKDVQKKIIDVNTPKKLN